MMKPFAFPLILVAMLVLACTAAASSSPSPTPTILPSASGAVTITAPPTSAPSTAEAVTVAVAFDGSTCTFAGPTDLARGSQVTFLLINTPAARVNSIGGALVVGAIADGTTQQQVVSDVQTRAADDPPAWFLNPSAVNPLYPQQADEGKTLTMTMAGNLYFVGVATSPSETDKMYLCTLLKVFDR